MTEERGDDGRRTTINAVENAFDIVEALQTLDGARLTELADHLDVPRSTAHIYLKTLEETEYVTREGDVYRVGLRFLEHGGYARRQSRLYRAAKEEVENLAERTGEAANLGVEEYGWRVLLYKARVGGAVSDNATTGERTYLHQTALGKVLLAFLSPERRDEIVDEHGLPAATDRTITDPAELTEEMRLTHERGYSIEDEEHRVGILAVGVPIQDRETDRVVGAVCLTGPKTRLEERLEDDLVDEVKSAANVVELRYNHH